MELGQKQYFVYKYVHNIEYIKRLLTDLQLCFK